ncbi:MAG: hypothetical protein ACXW3C_07930 [Pyrinomonadaceae bacterium]
MGKSQKPRVKKAIEKAKERELKKLIAQFQPKIDAVAERRTPRLVAILFCMYFSTDQEGRYNFLGCFDRVFADPTTKQTGQFVLVVRTSETREKGIVISVLDPANKVVAAVVFDEPKPMPTDKPMHLQYAGPINFTATTDGPYWIDVSYQGKSIGGESLSVEFGKPGEEKK